MKWKEFKQQQYKANPDFKLTDIECPECGDFIFQDTSIVLTSYPPQYRYFCTGCGWEGCAPSYPVFTTGLMTIDTDKIENLPKSITISTSPLDAKEMSIKWRKLWEDNR